MSSSSSSSSSSSTSSAAKPAAYSLRSAAAAAGGGGGCVGGGGGGNEGAGNLPAAVATGAKRPRAAAAREEDSRDAELRELRAKLQASEAAVLQAAAAKAADAKKAVEKATCVICADLWEAPVTAPGCGHACCKACLMDCAARKNECPQCRKQLVEDKPHDATAEFPTFASEAVFGWPVSVPLRELADEARAKEEPGSAAERSATAAARLLRLVPCHVVGAPLDLRIWPLTCAITTPADASAADSRGRSLLWWSCHKGLGIELALVDAGADVNAADAHFKRTPLMGCMEFYKRQHTIKKLLAKGADMHAVSAGGESVLDVLEPLQHVDDCMEYLLILIEADYFKGEAPPAKLLPSIGLAMSKRAHAGK